MHSSHYCRATELIISYERDQEIPGTKCDEIALHPSETINIFRTIFHSHGPAALGKNSIGHAKSDPNESTFVSKIIDTSLSLMTSIHQIVFHKAFCPRVGLAREKPFTGSYFDKVPTEQQPDSVRQPPCLKKDCEQLGRNSLDFHGI